MFLKNGNISSKIKRSKVTDYAALISRINEVNVFFNKISLQFICNRTCYCVNMVSLTSALRY